MRRTASLAGAAVLVVAAAVAGVLLSTGGGRSTAVAQAGPVATAAVQRGRLSASVAQDGILAYRARPDGSPFVAINHARGTYTALPSAGDLVRCRGVLYRVDDVPVLLLCGAVPAYRDLRQGDAGRDVRQLNRNLRVRGGVFTAATRRALQALERRRGLRPDGVLALGDAVVLPEAVRIAGVSGRLGEPARPGARVLSATSRTLHVEVDLAPFEQRGVRRGDRARITLPGSTTVHGVVVRFGRTARVPAGQGNGPADATVPTTIRLLEPGRVRGLDRAPVGVQIATAGVQDALSVPVTALLGRPGGGFAVEAVRAGGRRGLVAVRLGLFDTARGRVEVTGDLRAGDRVVVPPS